MSDRPSGFLAAYAARGNRSVLYLGLGLTLVGAALSWLFGNVYGMLFLSVPGLVPLAVWLRRQFDPTTHPVYTQLDQYGERTRLIDEVEDEFAGASTDGNGTAHLGARWLGVSHSFGVYLVPWQEVAWLYLAEQRKSGLVIGYNIRVWTGDPRVFDIVGDRDLEGRRDLLARLHERAPWAEVGYSPERQEEWGKNRAAVLARVEARCRAAA